MKDRSRLLRDYPFPESDPPRPRPRPRSPTLWGVTLPLPETRPHQPPLQGLPLPEPRDIPPTTQHLQSKPLPTAVTPLRSRTQTLRGVPLPRPPSHPPSIEETVVVDTDPNDEITEIMTSPRAKCTGCGYRAHHVQTFLDGLCGLCRTTVQE